MSTVEVVRLQSGVAAVRHLASGEVMHVGSGPEVEPQEIYAGPSKVAARLAAGGGNSLVLLDVGLGAAANALAAWYAAEAAPAGSRRLEIISLEHDLAPLALVLADRAAFAMSDSAHEACTALLRDHRHETAFATWRLLFGDLTKTMATIPDGTVDIVYWDPYSRATNGAHWNRTSFTEARRVCRDGATMHTFSTSTSVRSAMLLGGFAVGVGAATGNKAQTTIAATSLDLLENPLDARWLERLERSSAAFPADIESREQAFAAIRQCPQFRGI